MFREIFRQRFVNTVYFDTEELTVWDENVAGVADRTKYRIRWYGDLFGSIEEPVLELKTKSGLVGTKLSYNLKRLVLDRDFGHATVLTCLDASNVSGLVREKFTHLSPRLLNRYARRYFRSRDGHFRLTIDRDVTVYRICKYSNSFSTKLASNVIILELKYDCEKDDDAERISNCFPFRLSKNSKYVSGMTKVYCC